MVCALHITPLLTDDCSVTGFIAAETLDATFVLFLSKNLSYFCWSLFQVNGDLYFFHWVL